MFANNEKTYIIVKEFAFSTEVLPHTDSAIVTILLYLKGYKTRL